MENVLFIVCAIICVIMALAAIAVTIIDGDSRNFFRFLKYKNVVINGTDREYDENMECVSYILFKYEKIIGGLSEPEVIRYLRRIKLENINLENC